MFARVLIQKLEGFGSEWNGGVIAPGAVKVKSENTRNKVQASAADEDEPGGVDFKSQTSPKHTLCLSNMVWPLRLTCKGYFHE